MRGRRWSDWVDTDGTMNALDRSRRILITIWPFAASAAVMAVVLAATIVSVAAIKDRDRLAGVATNSAAAAVDAKRAAADAKLAATESAAAAERNRLLLEQAQPCLANDSPDTPACTRKAAADAYVAHILDSLAAGLADHDANASAQHDALRARLGVTSPAPARTPITARSAPTTAPRPATSAPAPVTTTTTCPKLPNGRCRP